MVEQFKGEYGRKPTLAVVSRFISNMSVDAATDGLWQRRPEMRYIQNIGGQPRVFISYQKNMPDTLATLNARTDVDGVMLELPIADRSVVRQGMTTPTEARLIEMIDASKDVAGLRSKRGYRAVAAPHTYPKAEAAAIFHIIRESQALGWTAPDSSNLRVAFAGFGPSLTLAHIKEGMQECSPNVSFYDAPPRIASMSGTKVEYEAEELHRRLNEADIFVAARGVVKAHLLRRGMYHEGMLVVDTGAYVDGTISSFCAAEDRKIASLGDIDIPFSYVTPRDYAALVVRKVGTTLLSKEQ
jgi:5,10-methylene-tetrahydrofolate dehydrogenase/methenyl tetrahydrofolate cyclohydrolase